MRNKSLLHLIYIFLLALCQIAGFSFVARGEYLFQQDSGSKKIVSIEAENYHDSTPAPDGHIWVPISGSNYSGGTAVQAVPADKLYRGPGYSSTSPRLDYQVEFVTTGTHYLWVRGLGANSGSDSLYVGLNGAEVATGENFNGFYPNGSLVWSGKSGTSVRTLNIPTVGVHTINVWMRESGMVFDKLVLTTDPGYVPSGAGPSESLNTASSVVVSPSISPNGGTFSAPVTVILSTSTSGADIYYTLNGTDPTTNSTRYTSPFVLTTSATVKAAAFLDGYIPSGVSNAIFAIGNPPPVLNPVGDKVATEGQTISFTVTANDPDATTPSLSADLNDLPTGAIFTDQRNGTGIFSWTPQTGDAAASPYAVIFTAVDAANPQLTSSETILITVNAANSNSAYLQDSGSKEIVSIEAENYHDSTPAPDGHIWVPISGSNYSGGTAVQAVPADKLYRGPGYSSTSPRLDYQVEFVTTGTHYLWVRGLGANSGSDSLYVGLNGAEVATGENFNGFYPNGSLVWSGKSGTSVRTLNIPTVGVHTINVWMRESGMVFDKLVLTTDPGYVPSGAGPSESLNTASSVVVSPSISPNGGTFSAPVTVILSTSTSGADIYYTLNGTDPTTNSTRYTSPFVLTTSATVKAAAFLDGYIPSGVSNAIFAIGNPPPVLNPVGDKVATEGQTISFTVTANDPDATTPSLSADLNDLPTGAIFTDQRNGTGIFSWTPQTGDAAASPYAVIFTAVDAANPQLTSSETILITVNAANSNSAYLQDSGSKEIVSIEAENYHDSTPAPDGHIWVPISGSNYSGGTAVQAVPADKLYRGPGYSSTSPRLDYQVEFVTTGTHYLWVRGLGANSGSDSLYVGLNGAEVATGENFNGFYPNGSLVWSGKSGTSVRTLNIPTVGVHTINVWMRESGMVFDKLVLTTDPGYVPSGAGPSESLNNGFFFDDFYTDTTADYIVTDTLTGGGLGQFVYDDIGRRAEIITGANIGLKYSRNLTDLSTGVFKMEFLPIRSYTTSGTFRCRLKENDNTYYEILNTDGTASGFVRKVVGGIEVNRIGFSSGYSQYKNYHLLINFSPGNTKILAFGMVFSFNSNSTAIFVNRFEVELVQQDGYFDNIEYTDTPFDYYVAIGDSITRGGSDDILSDGIGYEPILHDLLVGLKGYPHNISNEGVSGHTSVDGRVLLPTILNNHPDSRYFLIQYGTNDARIPIPSGLGLQPGHPSYPGTFKDNMQKIITSITAMGKIPYVAKVPKAFGSRTALNPYLQTYNQVIDELVASNNIGVIPPDFYCYFEDNSAQMADDLHPDGTGYQSMANLWRDALTDRYSGGCY